jgi:hypothetical protein
MLRAVTADSSGCRRLDVAAAVHRPYLSQVTADDIFLDSGNEVVDVRDYVSGLDGTAAGAYAVYDKTQTLQFVGVSKDLLAQLQVRPSSNTFSSSQCKLIHDLWLCLRKQCTA